MVDIGLLGFSVLQGIIAFFAPCAVVLLPGYLAAFLSKHHDGSVRSQRMQVLRALYLGLSAIVGVFVVYAIAGLLILLLNEVLKTTMPWISAGVGFIIILLGIAMVLGWTLSLPIHSRRFSSSHDSIEAFVFGIFYGVGALGCLFPLFLAVVLFALQAPSVVAGALYIGGYLFGMSVFMLAFFVLAVVARTNLQRWLRAIVPYMNRVAGVVLMLAGAYIIIYQSPLLF